MCQALKVNHEKQDLAQRLSALTPGFVGADIANLCIAAGTLVACADGLSRPIESIRSGAAVLAHVQGRLSASAVRGDAVCMGQRDCVELLLSDGRTLVCTPDHRVLTRRGWVEADALQLTRCLPTPGHGAELAAGDELLVGGQFPAVGSDDASAGWRLAVSSLQTELTVDEAGIDCTLAFARLLGLATTDCCRSLQEGGADSCCELFVSHRLDATAVQDDVALVTGFRPAADSVGSQYRLQLPQPLVRGLLACSAKRARRDEDGVSALPAAITAADCPLPVVREFLGARFGGDGVSCALSPARDGRQQRQLTPIAMLSTVKGSLIQAAERQLRSGLLPLLVRCGVDADQLKVQLSLAGRRRVWSERLLSAEREADASYLLRLVLSSSATLAFARGVGFRYSADKQLRLSAACIALSSRQFVSQQRERLQSAIEAERALSPADGRQQLVQRALQHLAAHELLHVATEQWAANCAVAGRDVPECSDEELLTAAGAMPVFSRQESHCPDPHKTTAERLRQKRQQRCWRRALHRAASTAAAAAAAAPSAKPSVSGRLSRLCKSSRHSAGSALAIDGLLPPDASGLPAFTLTVVAKRAVGRLQVYDLTVPVGRSFLAGGVVVHNCNEAALIAARGGKDVVELVDFERAADRIIGGLEKHSAVMTPAEKRRVAFHEAGHAVIGWFLEHADPLLKVTIVPRGGGALGFAQYLPRELSLYTQPQLLDMMCMTLGGRAAEQHFFSDVSTGAADDLQKVTRIAQAQVSTYGMSKRLGNVSYHQQSASEQPEFTRPFSEATAQTIDEEVRELISNAYERTVQLVQQHAAQVLALAERLIASETVNHDGLVDVLGPRPFVNDAYSQWMIHSAQDAQQRQQADKDKTARQKEEQERDDGNKKRKPEDGRTEPEPAAGDAPHILNPI